MIMDYHGIHYEYGLPKHYDGADDRSDHATHWFTWFDVFCFDDVCLADIEGRQLIKEHLFHVVSIIK